MTRYLLQGIFFCVAFVSARAAFAQVGLYYWDRGSELPAIVIPVPEGQTALGVWKSYIEGINENPKLADFTLPTDLAVPEAKSFKSLSYDPQKHSLLLANTAGDLSPTQSRPRNWTKLMSDRGVKNFVLPVAIGSLLTTANRNQFHQEIASHFSILFPLGGADVDPHIYGESPRGARGYNGEVDRYESELIKHYIQAEKGFIYATCRGAQMTAVSMGYKLVQDVPSQLKHANQHWDIGHDVSLDNNNELIARIFKGLEKVFIYSYHHQAIEFKAEGPLLLAGVSDDGISEILTFKNGRGLLMQGHPELTLGGQKSVGDVAAAKILFDGFVKDAQAKTRFTCGKLFL